MTSFAQRSREHSWPRRVQRALPALHTGLSSSPAARSVTGNSAVHGGTRTFLDPVGHPDGPQWERDGTKLATFAASLYTWRSSQRRRRRRRGKPRAVRPLPVSVRPPMLAACLATPRHPGHSNGPMWTRLRPSRCPGATPPQAYLDRHKRSRTVRTSAQMLPGPCPRPTAGHSPRRSLLPLYRSRRIHLVVRAGYR